MISIAVPCTTRRESSVLIRGRLNQYKVRAKTTTTKKKINVIKNIKSWCKLIIPSMIGEAGSWKYICQGKELSSCRNIFIKKIVGFEPKTPGQLKLTYFHGNFCPTLTTSGLFTLLKAFQISGLIWYFFPSNVIILSLLPPAKLNLKPYCC